MISKSSALIILDLLDKRIDEVNERLLAAGSDENLVIRIKNNLQNYENAKDELKKEMDRW